MNSSFNPYSPGFSIYLKISFYLLNNYFCFNPYSPGFSIYLDFNNQWQVEIKPLQSLFTWIFYLFIYSIDDDSSNHSASILIHLDFLSISTMKHVREYLYQVLQSLFTWIFYLFSKTKKLLEVTKMASILIHLDFLSI